MNILRRVLKRLPKSIRRKVGELWNSLDYNEAIAAVDGWKYCLKCDARLEWDPWAKTLKCPHSDAPVYEAGKR